MYTEEEKRTLLENSIERLINNIRRSGKKMVQPLDVPHWAIFIVSSYRKELTIPPHITDREIYAALLAGEMDAVRALIASHQHKGTTS